MAKVKPDDVITILLVDDIAEIRAKVKQILSFESDFKIIGMAGSGREGLAMAKELRPDIVIMDINMPDIDGLQVTTQIMSFLPETGIIILSAQDDQSYIRLAMIAGAKAFLTKPSSPDELYNNVRAVYGRARAPKIQTAPVRSPLPPSSDGSQNRAGNIITVYSPQGGAGCTTIATNLAAALTRDHIRVLLVDANLQFGDIGVFLNLEARSTLVDLVEDIDDMDRDYFENVVTTHTSGLKVLMGPTRPELAEKVMSDPTAISRILGKIRESYDFIVIDTSLHLDEMVLSLMDVAARVILVSTPNLTSVKNIRFVLDLFDQLDYPHDKTMLILNRVSEDQNIRKLSITTDKVALFLKRQVTAIIPTDEYLMLDAIRKGIPAVTLERDADKSPVKELIALSNTIIADLLPQALEQASTHKEQKMFRRIGTRKRVEHES
jgi:pilus assembly protein CpaE